MSEHEELLGRLDDCAAIRAIGNGHSERNTFAEAAVAIRKLEAERDAARALLKEAGEVVGELTMDRHTFAPMTAPNGDTCVVCKSDLRHPIHFRAGESVMGDFRRARAFLTKIKEAINDQ